MNTENITGYIYNIDDQRAVAVVTGPQEAVEEYYLEHYDQDCYAWTSSPAFGFANGLRGIADDAEEIRL